MRALEQLKRIFFELDPRDRADVLEEIRDHPDITLAGKRIFLEAIGQEAEALKRRRRLRGVPTRRRGGVSRETSEAE